MNNVNNTNLKENEILDLCDEQLLDSSHVIEASAGTGKTYTITALVVRYLLEKNLDIEKILVVSFTNASVSDLKKRIYERIISMRETLELYSIAKCYSNNVDEFEKKYIEIHYKNEKQSKELQDAIVKLQNAEKKIDNAPISTLDSFSQKILRENAFESGSLFQNRFITSEDELLEDALKSTYRKYTYSDEMSDEESYFLKKFFKDDNNFYDKLSYLKEKFTIYIKGYKTNIDNFKNVEIDFSSFTELLHKVEYFYKKVPLKPVYDRELSFIDCIKILDFFKKIFYTKDQTKLRSKFLTGTVTELFVESCLYYPISVDDKNSSLLEQTDESQRKKNYENISKELISEIKNFQNEFNEYLIEFNECLNSISKNLLIKFLEDAKKYLEKKKIDLEVLSFNDVKEKFKKALCDNNQFGDLLAARIRENYPVALIDEYQDTDAIQYNIFKKIYVDNSSKNSQLFIIGDPKQAIYRFRDADINSYFMARNDICDPNDPKKQGNLKTLDTNYRSDSALIFTINKLFEEKVKSKDQIFSDSIINDENGEIPIDKDTVFQEFGKIKYIPIKSKEKVDKFIALKNDDGTFSKISPLYFNKVNEYFNEEDVRIDSNSNKKILANLCSLQIKYFLDKCVFVKKENDTYEFDRNLSNSDICVIVNSGTEADYIKNSLKKFNLESVYLSDKSSIKSKELEKSLILNFMKTLNKLSDQTLIRNFLSSPLLVLTFDEINTILNDDGEYEKFINCLGECRKIWNKNSFVSAFNMLLNYRFFDNDKESSLSLIEKIKKLESGETFLTNLLHLSEIIQQQEQKQPSTIALMNWFENFKSLSELEDELDESDSYKIRLSTERKKIKIYTTFASKGLEFDLVMLPFIAINNIKEKDDNFVCHLFKDNQFEDDFSYQLYNDGNQIFKNLSNSDYKKEGIRLLYVALTRAKYANWVGIPAKPSKSPNAKKGSVFLSQLFLNKFNGLKCDESEIEIAQQGWEKYIEILDKNCKVFREQAKNEYNSSKGQQSEYLESYKNIIKDFKLCKEIEFNPEQVVDFILNNSEISIKSPENNCFKPSLTSSDNDDKKTKSSVILKAKDFNCAIDTSWTITSYSSLHSGNSKQHKVEKNEVGQNNQNDAREIDLTSPIFDQFHYPKGATPGSFLHEIFEKINFQVDENTLREEIKTILKESFYANANILKPWKLEKNDIPQGLECLTSWIKNILEQEIFINDNQSFSLKNLNNNSRISEAEFIFKLNKLNVDDLNKFFIDLCSQGKWLGDSIDPLSFNEINGFLKGFIDLTFEFNGKYYIVDYKSNYLGDKKQDYCRKNMEKVIAEKRYDLQYCIYTLSLYRFLKFRFPNKKFSELFGGVIYLFLRGIEKDNEEKDPESILLRLGNHSFYGCYDTKISDDIDNFMYEFDKIFNRDGSNN